MPTVEDYFDDDTDIPLPSSSASQPARRLSGSGHRGALLEEINDDPVDFDYSQLAEQGRGVFGEGSSGAPARPASTAAEGKGKMTAREPAGDLRPSGPAAAGLPNINPNTPMGGFMGDMMRMQQAEEERVEKLRKQFGSATLAQDPSVYKEWNTVYPIYFDAKVSVADGRRVPRQRALWWPQAAQISYACRTLGLPCVLEPDKCHPADWENPGRVKVQISRDNKLLNPIVKNRTLLYRHLADQLQQQNSKLRYSRPKRTPSSKAPASAKAVAKEGGKRKSSRADNGGKEKTDPRRLPPRPPRAPEPIPVLDQRFPLHSPVVPTGVGLSAMKRDIEAEKEAKKKGITGGDDSGKDKMPKMKRVVVRGKR